MSTMEDICLLRDAAAVKRYHTARTLRQQTLAEHSFGVMTLIKQLFPECRVQLLFAAMHHDLPEYITGDIPAPAKRASPALAVLLEQFEQGTAPLYEDFRLTADEESLLKWCDTMELVLWCLEELQMGNAYVMGMARVGLGWTREAPTRYMHVRSAASSLWTEAVQHAARLGVTLKEETV